MSSGPKVLKFRLVALWVVVSGCLEGTSVTISVNSVDGTGSSSGTRANPRRGGPVHVTEVTGALEAYVWTLRPFFSVGTPKRIKPEDIL